MFYDPLCFFKIISWSPRTPRLVERVTFFETKRQGAIGPCRSWTER